MNVIILSMGRCGVSWIGETLKSIYKNIYGKRLHINYENKRSLISNNLVDGWHSVYDIDPRVLLELGYDKVLAVKRDLETLKYTHAKYSGYLEVYKSYESMKQQRDGFFKRIELTYKLLYEQNIDDSRYHVVRLEDLNNYTYDTFNEIIEFLEFKLSFTQKIKLFFRILRNKVQPFVIPIKPIERNWEVYSSLLPRGYEVCERLKYIQKIDNKKIREIDTK